MNHTCQDRGGPCHGCACEDARDASEEKLLKTIERWDDAIDDLAEAAGIKPDMLKEYLWDKWQEGGMK